MRKIEPKILQEFELYLRNEERSASCKNHACDDFLRRHYPHQVKGSKFGYFLSACSTSSPVFVCWAYYTAPFDFVQLGIRTKSDVDFGEYAGAGAFL